MGGIEQTTHEQSAKSFSDACAKALAESPVSGHLLLAQQWLLQVVKPRIDATINFQTNPEDIAQAYTEEALVFARNIDGVAGKIASVTPNYDLYTGHNSGDLILSKTSEDIVQSFLARAYAEDALWEGDDEGMYTPQLAYDAFTRALAHDFDAVIREVIMSAPRGLSSDDIGALIYTATKQWVADTLGTPDTTTVHKKNTLLSFVDNALTKARGAHI